MKKINDDLLRSQNKIKWACRRGMLELDVLLNNFFAESYPLLRKEEQQLFNNLLSYSDPEIFSWLLGQEEPKQDNLKKITQAIRMHARSRI